MTTGSCAGQWGPRASGPVTFDIENRTPETMDVQLLATGTPRVYAEIPTLGSGTTRPLTVTLGAGRYTWQCASLDGVIYASNPAEVTGATPDPTPGYIPVTLDQISEPVLDYRQEVASGLTTLAAATDKLQALVDASEWDQAKAQWLVAHLDYERLGAAYDTFGDFDDEINGRADGLPGGVNDPNFTGFRRLEYGLWNNQPSATLAAVAAKLDGYVHGLIAAFPHQATNAIDLPLRTHEILENALQFELTGDTDEGSHTNLATVSANVQGTQMTLNAIAPLLSSRDPSLLASAQSGLAGLGTLVDSYQEPDGWWTPVQSLTPAQRERLDAATSQLLEQLSLVPGTLRIFAVGAS